MDSGAIVADSSTAATTAPDETMDGSKVVVDSDEIFDQTFHNRDAELDAWGPTSHLANVLLKSSLVHYQEMTQYCTNNECSLSSRTPAKKGMFMAVGRFTNSTKVDIELFCKNIFERKEMSKVKCKACRLMSTLKEYHMLDLSSPLFAVDLYKNRNEPSCKQLFSMVLMVVPFITSKTLRLLGMMLNDGVHFISITSLVDMYVLHDGAKPFPHCKLIALDVSDREAKRVQENYELSYILYQVVDEGEDALIGSDRTKGDEAVMDTGEDALIGSDGAKGDNMPLVVPSDYGDGKPKAKENATLLISFHVWRELHETRRKCHGCGKWVMQGESCLEMSKKWDSKYCHATRICIADAINNDEFPFKNENIDTTLDAFIAADLKTDNEEVNYAQRILKELRSES